MRILMMVSWFNDKADNKIDIGGFHYDQAVALKNYCDIAIYYPYDKSLKNFFEVEEEFCVLTYRSKKERRLGKWLRILKDFKKINRLFRPDIIHAQCAGTVGIIAVIIGKLFNIPVIITEHQAFQTMSLDKFKDRKKYEYVYSNSVANICVSDFLTKNLSLIYPKQKFSTIHNGTVVDSNVDYTGSKSYRKDGMVNCCIIGGFYSKEIKGYQYLLPAVSALNKRKSEQLITPRFFCI